MTTSANTGQYIKDRRKQLGFTQEDVLRELRERGIETSAPSLSKLEAGNLSLLTNPVTLDAIAKVLKISKKRLLTEAGLLAADSTAASDEEYFLELLRTLDPTRREILFDIVQTLADRQHAGG
jgi:transcriptional regulator with XRE-family HTH domain